MNERGSAVIVVAALMGLVAALAAGLALGASTVATVTRNHRDALLVRAAADAGAEQAVAVVLPGLRQWRAEGLAVPTDALTDVLTRGRMWRALVAGGLPVGPGPASGAAGVTTVVDILDDDAPGRGLDAADIVRIGEDGQTAHDANGRLVVRAIAHAPQGAAATVEATVGMAPLPAALLRGRTRVDALTLTGREGHLMVMGDLDLGAPVAASGAVTATGHLQAALRPSTPSRVAGHARALLPPELRPEDFRGSADILLRADGLAGPSGSLAIGGASDAGFCRPPDAACPAGAVAWRFDAGTWRLIAVPGVPATVFVEGDATLAPESGLLTPIRLSVLATGSVLVRGVLALLPARDGLLLVAGDDVRIEGTLVADAAEGLVAAGEQVAILGPTRLRGAVVSAGRAHASRLVTENVLSGGAVIASDGGLAALGFVTWQVLAWRRNQAW